MAEVEEVDQNQLEDIEDDLQSDSENEGLSAPIIELTEPDIDLQSRYRFYCREWKLGRLSVEDVYSAVIEETSSALCPGPSDSFFAKTEDENGAYYWKVLEVDDCWALCKSFDGTDEEEQIHISELNPFYSCEEDRSIAEDRNLTIDMYKFYIDSIFRPWDRFDDNPKSAPFEPILRRRLNFCALMTEGAIPRHVNYRYKKQLHECARADEELAYVQRLLQQVQARLRIQSEDDNLRDEEEKCYESVHNEYLYKYSVWKVHSDHRQRLEDALLHEYQITKAGRTEIVRRKNGLRDMTEKKIIHHLVASDLSVKQIRNAVGDDAVIKTYGQDQLAEALANCFEEDEVILFPGVYDLNEYLFHESITVRGCGESADQVVILAEDDECNFIFADAENIRFKNLTFEARRNTEGCIVVNGGQCVLENCILNCDEITRGVIVRPYAACQIQSTIIKGGHEASVLVESAGTVVDGGNNEFSVDPILNQLKDPIIFKQPIGEIVRLVDNTAEHIGQKISSPRRNPAEGAGDTFAL